MRQEKPIIPGISPTKRGDRAVNLGDYVLTPGLYGYEWFRVGHVSECGIYATHTRAAAIVQFAPELKWIGETKGAGRACWLGVANEIGT